MSFIFGDSSNRNPSSKPEREKARAYVEKHMNRADLKDYLLSNNISREDFKKSLEAEAFNVAVLNQNSSVLAKSSDWNYKTRMSQVNDLKEIKTASLTQGRSATVLTSRSKF